jgi:ribosomal protein S27AE
MSQLKVVPLKCPSCGAKLEVSEDMDRFACGYCGTELVTQRRGGTVALKSLTDAIVKVQIGTDKTAAELALRRLQDELHDVRTHRAAQESSWQACLVEYDTAVEIVKKRKLSLWVIGALSIFVIYVIGSLTQNLLSTISYGLADSKLPGILALIVGITLFIFMVVVREKRNFLDKETLRQEIKADEMHRDQSMAKYDTRINELLVEIEDKKRFVNAK